ncbi:ParD-like family protein [Crenothrix polyspora]|nr:ParD-like family protein [Crenothrix polyspora]
MTTNVALSQEVSNGRKPSIRINQELYDQAKQDAALEHRSIAGQIEFWAKVGRAALDNPDLPVSFVAESLASISEPREQSQPFVPRR